MTRLRIFLTACLLTLSVTFVAQAQETKAQQPSEGQIARIRKDVSNEIMSPFCPGKNLDMCTSPNAAAVRRDIQDMAKQGKTKEEIKKAILNQYGDEFKVIEPPAEDNALLLGLILAGLIGAIGLLVFITRRKQRPATTTKTSTLEEEDEAPLSEDELAYLKRLETD